MRNPRRNGRLPDSAARRTPQMSGASANHAKMLRHGGIGPARGNGSSSNPALRTAAAQLIHDLCCILRRVYRNDSGNPGPCLSATISGMILALLGMRIIDTLFFLGLAGSAIVILISFVEDGRELFGED